MGANMTIYDSKLGNLVRDNKMKKKNLQAAASISSYMMTKLNRNEPVPMEGLLWLCKLTH